MIQPTPSEVDAVIRAVLSGSDRGAKVFADRLFALRHAEALPDGSREVRIAPGTVVTPLARDALDAGDDGAGGAAFNEGTQALLDRLERLADLRDRGMLGAEEYETAKASVMRELEARS